MTQNVGCVDRALRIVAGLLLIALAYAGTIGAWGYIGVVPFLTGLIRYCPAYSLFGCKTVRSDSCGTGCGTGCKSDSK